MISLSDRTAVPQIFLNDVHVGGATELLAELESDEDRYRAAIETGPEPSDPRLAIPTGPPLEERPPPPRREGPLTFGSGRSFATYVELHRFLTETLPRGDVRRGLRTHANAFRGSKAVAAAAEKLGTTRAEATAFLDAVARRGAIVRAAGGSPGNAFADARDEIWRLPRFGSPGTLNSLRVWNDRVDPDAVGLVIRLKKKLSSLTSRHADESTGLPDLVAAAADPSFVEFEEAVCELRAVDAFALDRDAKTAFFVNLYNLCVEHATIAVGVAAKTSHRGLFFSRVGYEVGGRFLSLNDVEHGVLRANARPPYSLSAPFGARDPRRPLALTRVDPRIHFALNCGARSCPPVKTFRAESVDEELRVVAESFVEDDDNVAVGEDDRTLTLSRILDWYGGDFATKRSDLAAVLAGLARDGTDKQRRLKTAATAATSVRIEFRRYDWSANASRVKDFSPAEIGACGPFDFFL